MMRDVENGTSAGEDATRNGPNTTTESSRNKKKTILVWSLVGLAVVTAVSLGLGFGLSNNNNNNNNSNDDAGTKQTSVQASETTPTTGSNSGTTTTTTNSSTTAIPDSPVILFPSNNNSGGGGGSIAIASTRLASISTTSIAQTYASCDDLANDLKLVARLVGERTIKDYAWYFQQPTFYYDNVYGNGTMYPTVIAEDLDGNETSSPAAPVSAPSDVSGGSKQNAEQGVEMDAAPGASTSNSFNTNNQVFGVEEADIVQSNGVKVFALYGTEIIELNANLSTIARRTKIVKDETPDCTTNVYSMLLIGERLVTMTNSYCWGPYVEPTTVTVEESVTNTTDGGSASSSSTSSSSSSTTTTMPIVSSYDATSVLVYDTKTMELLSNETLTGYYVSSRAIGDNVHVITSTWFDFYRLTQFLDPYLIESDVGYRLNETEYNRLAKAELEKRADAFATRLAGELDCTGMQKIALMQNTDDELGFANRLESMVTISSFAASAPSTVSKKQMLIPSGGLQVYSSAERLVLSIQGWYMGESATEETYLVTYKYVDATTSPQTLGSVPGYVLNQFSMDHSNQNGVDYLRVASTTQSIWALNDKGIWESTSNSTSQVTILEFSDGVQGEMPVIGQLKGLGKPGEQIYSVRFMGVNGYVVTFKQTDPFYTLDLSDPANPRKVGELQMPGYSSYLHPVSESLILGVGQGADANGTITGLQISLFDVSDFDTPVRVQNFEMKSQNSATTSSSTYSEAEYDHKAFRYLEDSKLLIIPVTNYEYTYGPCPYNEYDVMPAVEDGEAAAKESANATEVVDIMPGRGYGCTNMTGGFDGFKIYSIDVTAGISEYFSIEHGSSNDLAYGCWSAAYLQARSLVFDGDIMTLKGHSILSHDLATRQQDATPINLDTEVVECNPWIYY